MGDIVYPDYWAERQAADELLARAKDAAANGDPRGMLAALYRSGFLDGIKRSLTREWAGQVAEHEIDECVAQAVDHAYEQLMERKRITRLDAWLWKVSKNLVVDQWRDDYSRRSTEEVQGLPDGSLGPPEGTAEDGSEQDLDPNKRRREGIMIARQIVPTLGQGNIVAVMDFVLDAVEADVIDLPPREIADALGLKPATVRKLLERGFRRLARAAKDRGLHITDDDLPGFGTRDGDAASNASDTTDDEGEMP